MNNFLNPGIVIKIKSTVTEPPKKEGKGEGLINSDQRDQGGVAPADC
jgi:hypothetical protein